MFGAVAGPHCFDVSLSSPFSCKVFINYLMFPLPFSLVLCWGRELSGVWDEKSWKWNSCPSFSYFMALFSTFGELLNLSSVTNISKESANTVSDVLGDNWNHLLVLSQYRSRPTHCSSIVRLWPSPSCTLCGIRLWLGTSKFNFR